MPLQITYQASTDEAPSTVYARIARVLLDPLRQAVRVEVAFYRSAAAATSRQPVELRPYHVEGADLTTYFAPTVLARAGVQPITQAEAWLKATQAEFAAAVDV